MKPLYVALIVLCSTGQADDFAARCADRAAIERVCYERRLGEKPPFAETLPPATLEKLVRQDLRKATLLQRTYCAAIAPALLTAEVQRINTTTETLSGPALSLPKRRYEEWLAKQPTGAK
jgi:hypothetical protein